jgi:hypothetical protein
VPGLRSMIASGLALMTMGWVDRSVMRAGYRSDAGGNGQYRTT